MLLRYTCLGRNDVKKVDFVFRIDPPGVAGELLEEPLWPPVSVDLVQAVEAAGFGFVSIDWLIRGDRARTPPTVLQVGQMDV